MTDYTPSGYPDPSNRWVSSLLDAEFALIAAAIRSKLNGNLYYSGTEAQGATVNDYVVTVSPAPTSYATRSFLAFKATHTNSGAATVAISGLPAKTIKSADGTSLASGDISSVSAVLLFYDGTDYYLISGNDRSIRSGDTYTGTHAMTGATLTVATQSVGDNSTKAASTAYVDSTFAPIASPALTGSPTAPTAAPGTNNDILATTAFASALAYAATLPGGAIPPVYVNTNTTVVHKQNLVDSSGGSLTLTLPASPTLGDSHQFSDARGTWEEFPVTLDRNGKSIVDPYGAAQAENLTLNQNNAIATLFYDGTNWRLI